MDDDLGILEAELQRMRPAAPSRALLARVGRELELKAAQGRGATLRWLWIAALPVAAALAVVFLQLSPRKEPRGGSLAGATPSFAADAPAVVSEAALKPVAAENLLVSTRDEGLVTLEDGTQARRQRRQYIDTILWKDPRTNASLTWRLPREEVLVVPILLQ